MKLILLTVFFAILMVTVLGAPTTDIAKLAGRTINPPVYGSDGSPIKLEFCCKNEPDGWTYKLVCGNLCSPF